MAASLGEERFASFHFLLSDFRFLFSVLRACCRRGRFGANRCAQEAREAGGSFEASRIIQS
jgi:hypothetical protein